MRAFRPVAAGAAGAAASAPAAASRPAVRSTPTVAPLSAAPQVAVASAPVARPAPVVSAPSAAPASVATSARAAALEAARAASGKRSSATPAAAVTAPAAVASAPADLPPALDEVPPPWDEDTAAAAAQKKTEQYSSTAGAELNAPAEAIVVAAPPVSTVTPAMAAQTAQVAASLEWNGNWPQLAAELPLRGMVQQMAQQSELTHCEMSGNTVCFHLRIPVETLRAAGNIEKLCTVLGERFGRSVRVETEIGVVANTANAKAEADRAERQREAELTVQQDPFVQAMMREFGASIVPGSIRPL
jgi:DNA polymerase-3 subunit gamma/tau